MIDQGMKTQIQTIAAGFCGFVGVVGVGSLLLLHHGGAAVKAPVTAYAPVDADSALLAPARNRPSFPAAPDASASASSPAPLLPDDAREEAAASAAPGAAAAPAAAAAAAKLVAGQHLDASSSASSSASASVAAAQKPKAPAAKKPFLPPKLDLSKNQGTVASTVHYGVSSRAELMGRAAGPVYNFSGKSLGQAQSAQVAADNSGQDAAGAMQQVDAAQKTLDASNLPADQKAQIDQNLNQARQTAVAAPAGQ